MAAERLIAVPVAIGIQAGAVVCGLLGAGGKLKGRKLQIKAKKHNQIRILANSKLNPIADHVSATQADDKISDEEFRLILSKVDKYNQMKEGIRGSQKQGISCRRQRKRDDPESERKGDGYSPYQAVGRAQSWHRRKTYTPEASSKG